MKDSLFTRSTIVVVLLMSTATLANDDSVVAPASGQTVRLLTIGNSFSRNATRFLGELAEAGGHHLTHTSIVVGGASLELHATKALLHEQDPSDEEGLYDGSKRSLKQELQSQPWDFVTIQQASIKSHDLATYQPFAQQLGDLIATHAPTARLLVHETWPYRQDDPRFSPEKPAKPDQPSTQEAMYEGLRNAYRQVASQLDAGLIPVGDAFYLADTNPRWGYQTDTTFDFATAGDPALPVQTHSLHVGWRWVKKKDEETRKLEMDGHHASLAGEYLALVFSTK